MYMIEILLFQQPDYARFGRSPEKPGGRLTPISRA